MFPPTRPFSPKCSWRWASGWCLPSRKCHGKDTHLAFQHPKLRMCASTSVSNDPSRKCTLPEAPGERTSCLHLALREWHVKHRQPANQTTVSPRDMPTLRIVHEIRATNGKFFVVRNRPNIARTKGLRLHFDGRMNCTHPTPNSAPGLCAASGEKIPAPINQFCREIEHPRKGNGSLISATKKVGLCAPPGYGNGLWSPFLCSVPLR